MKHDRPAMVITKAGVKVEQFPGGTVRTGAATPVEIAEYKAEGERVAYKRNAANRIAKYKADVASAATVAEAVAASKLWSEAVTAENRARVSARHRALQEAATKRLHPEVEDMSSGNQRINKET